jgi:hypothetical protein
MTQLLLPITLCTIQAPQLEFTLYLPLLAQIAWPPMIWKSPNLNQPSHCPHCLQRPSGHQTHISQCLRHHRRQVHHILIHVPVHRLLDPRPPRLDPRWKGPCISYLMLPYNCPSSLLSPAYPRIPSQCHHSCHQPFYTQLLFRILPFQMHLSDCLRLHNIVNRLHIMILELLDQAWQNVPPPRKPLLVCNPNNLTLHGLEISHDVVVVIDIAGTFTVLDL